MIIWINGAFGSGKSTTAELLHSKIEFSHIFDPEQVGYFLWDNFPAELKEKGDFQDIEIWRSINYQIIKHMHDNYNGVLIIPMTITDINYYNQIIGNLIENGVEVYHFILNADKENIESRLICRGECENSWAKQQIDRCLQAFARDINGEKINTNSVNVEQVVNVIMKKITMGFL
ncbi:tunicamycin resistance protein [Clostridium chromiireducens]|uniref:Tunicamycin resistance protein n=1 Tax=Clostridium chromiireducens TaxID=225345 RepID=A0A964RPW4_9CLOT|nr:AAA family ATPase [Clostridium chromiireducens]MVX65671.1 tunicamycin resistance protein [Clostridium chromiireducens]